jgi:lipoate-protein ligase A
MTTEHEALYPAEVEARWKAFEWELIPGVPEAPPMNLALDEVLTKSVGRGERRPTLRFWGWNAPCVVLGRFQSVRNEVQIDHAREDGIQLVRRISGGGAMFIEPPLAITYSIHVPPAFVEGLSFPQSYAFFDSWVIEALRELGIDAWYAPLNDITSAGGKIGGAAQARRFGGVLHHTTMAYDMNIPAMMRTLRIGQEKLSDKGLRSADKRVGPLRQQTNLPRETIIERMSASFTRRTNAAAGAITVDERTEAEELVASKFATEAWTFLLP